MMHVKRKWIVKTYEDPGKLAQAMLDQVWTLCTGFRLPVEGGGSLLVLNDSAHEDAMTEWAIMRVPPNMDDKVLAVEQGQAVSAKVSIKQIESLTQGNPEDEGGEDHASAGLHQALFDCTLMPDPPGVMPITVALEASEIHEGGCCA